jgi:hypothetical protein
MFLKFCLFKFIPEDLGVSVNILILKVSNFIAVTVKNYYYYYLIDCKWVLFCGSRDSKKNYYYYYYYYYYLIELQMSFVLWQFY